MTKMARITSQLKNGHELMIISTLYDNISSCNLTDGWILTSTLGIRNLFVEIPKFYQVIENKNWLKLAPSVPTMNFVC